MTYELTITRSEERGTDYDATHPGYITFEQWNACAAGDAELDLINHDPFINQPAPGFCHWLSYPGNPERAIQPWFVYHNGTVRTKADPPVMRKTLQIAAALDAFVVGEEGERFTEEMIDEIEQFMQLALAQDKRRK